MPEPEGDDENMLPPEIIENIDPADKLNELDRLGKQVDAARLALVRQIYAEAQGSTTVAGRMLGRRPQYVDNIIKRHGPVAPKKDDPDS